MPEPGLESKVDSHHVDRATLPSGRPARVDVHRYKVDGWTVTAQVLVWLFDVGLIGFFAWGFFALIEGSRSPLIILALTGFPLTTAANFIWSKSHEFSRTAIRFAQCWLASLVLVAGIACFAGFLSNLGFSVSLGLVIFIVLPVLLVAVPLARWIIETTGRVEA